MNKNCQHLIFLQKAFHILLKNHLKAIQKKIVHVNTFNNHLQQQQIIQLFN